MRSALTVPGLLLLILVLVISCQKELSLELSTAEASIKDTTGNCLPLVVNGTYQKETILTGQHFIEATIDVAVPGHYLIQTNTINGFFFKAEGMFVSSGLQVVKLPGSGTPEAAGDFEFIVSYGSNSCPVTVSVTDIPGDAVYAITDTAGNCPVVAIQGVYMETVPADSSNKVIFAVQVARTGSYHITTDTVNGISFEGSGSFDNTGIQDVTLYATGTPDTTGDYTIFIRDDSSNCSFNLGVEAAINTPAEYTLDCGAIQVAGSYTNGVAMTDTNTVKVLTTVTIPGRYTITTTTVNGISFSATGIFASATGSPVRVILKAAGTPLTRGSFDYLLSGASNNCAFRVDFTGL